MSDLLERAARAISDKWMEKVDDSTVRIGPPVIARTALLAALDLEDDKLTERIAKRIYIGRNYGKDDRVTALKWSDPRMREAYRADAHNAILALRSIVNDGTPEADGGS